MDFPVTEEFARTANAAQLHDEAAGDSPEWPASFCQPDEDGEWVYRVQTEREKMDGEVVAHDDNGAPIFEPRPDVHCDPAHVAAAIAHHVPRLSPEQQAEAEAALQLDELRTKAAAGQALTDDEKDEALRLLLAGRP